MQLEGMQEILDGQTGLPQGTTQIMGPMVLAGTPTATCREKYCHSHSGVVPTCAYAASKTRVSPRKARCKPHLLPEFCPNTRSPFVPFGPRLGTRPKELIRGAERFIV